MKPRVLVVDDEFEILHLLKNRLVSWGFEVSLAQTPQEFRRKALSEDFDLIILDIMLGEENGPQIYSVLLDQGLSQNIPVIFLSALVTDHPASHGYPGRHCTLHAKPIAPQELLEEIKTSLVAG